MAAIKIIGAKMTGGTTTKIIASMGTRITIGTRVAGISLTGATVVIAKEALTAATVDGDTKRVYPLIVGLNLLRMDHSGHL